MESLEPIENVAHFTVESLEIIEHVAHFVAESLELIEQDIHIVAESLEPIERREIIYCKRAVLSLSSSKILTPHPPLRPASVYPPAFVGGEDTLARQRGGWGVNILEGERDRIALLQ